MAKSLPHLQGLLQKALHDKKVLTQQVLMYQRFMKIMRDENSFEHLLQALILLITKGLGYDRAGIFLADKEHKIAELVLGIDRHGNFEGRGPAYQYVLSPAKGASWLSDMIHGHKKAFYTNNIRRGSRKKNGPKSIDPGVICNAVVPIVVSNQEIIGVIAVDNLFTQRSLKRSDLRALIDFATEAGLAIESFQLQEKIRSMTFRDGLTGAFNRRFFDSYLPREVLRCARYKRSLSLIYVDLDHFKSINDLYGHPAGDLVLRESAERMEKVLRNADTLARMGGDEFAVILPEVDAEGVRYVGLRLFQTLTRSPMPLERLGHPNLTVGATMGIACLGESQGSHEKLIHLADQSLYQAKKSGRNRVGNLVVEG
jgi:diguanylate cyclase (GGDEF)-like protein